MATGGASRCATHPARPAIDRCPVCDRPRCGVDAEIYAARGCPACYRPTVNNEPPRRELLVRAGLAALGVAFVGGWVATQYVRQHVFSLLAPALVGLAVSGAAAAAGRGLPRVQRLLIAAGAAVLSAAIAFTLTPGGQSPLHPIGTVVPPYLAAVIGVIAWPVLFASPRSSVRDGQPEGVTDR